MRDSRQARRFYVRGAQVVTAPGMPYDTGYLHDSIIGADDGLHLADYGWDLNIGSSRHGGWLERRIDDWLTDRQAFEILMGD